MKQTTECKEGKGRPMCQFGWSTTVLMLPREKPKDPGVSQYSEPTSYRKQACVWGPGGVFPNSCQTRCCSRAEKCDPVEEEMAFKTTGPALPPWDGEREDRAVIRDLPLLPLLLHLLCWTAFTCFLFFFFAALFRAFSLRFPGSIRAVEGEGGGARTVWWRKSRGEKSILCFSVFSLYVDNFQWGLEVKLFNISHCNGYKLVGKVLQ